MTVGYATMSKETERKMRKNEIRRNILRLVSYIDIILGILNLFIAFHYNHNGIADDDFNVKLYAIIGIVVTYIGIGGVNYEKILRLREASFRRNVQFFR